MPTLLLVILFIILIVVLFCLIAMNTACRRLQRKDSKKQLDLIGNRFFYRYLSRIFFPKQEYENFHIANLFAQNITRFAYTMLAVVSVSHIQAIKDSVHPNSQTYSVTFDWPTGFFLMIGLFLVLFLFSEYLARVIGTRYPKQAIRTCSPIVSCIMTFLFPFLYIFLKFVNIFPQIYADPAHEPSHEAKEELLEIIEEFNLNAQLDPHDKKLIESVMEFKDRIAREVMVPRVDIFSLSDDTTIEEAAKFLSLEGYSRTPVYKDTLDNIVGVLMYKDVLAKYMEHVQNGDKNILKTPISSLVKNILYTPETKKIAQLLQEFRKKQVHLAIIVDEYGGTEGIVTIEDILEEIVGDIADEYDEAEALFLPLPEGGWIIDARMGTLDIEEQLGIPISQDGDYDTIGGYVFHETGMIPPKGYTIIKPNFELEVIRSNNRRVEKLRIKPINLDE
ncbi:MAG: hemolysin family protein [Parachlamydiaceae bacterium]|nr:hemolysin family protein [Parachlamydiaceae bacterium]